MSTFSIFTVFAYEIDKDDKIYVGGESIGIKLNTGVTVIGADGIYEEFKLYKPWYEAGIKEGDKIVSLNGKNVTETNLNNNKKFNEALNKINILLEQNKDNPFYYELKGQIYIESGKLKLLIDGRTALTKLLGTKMG